jgi:hypothetical protein
MDQTIRVPSNEYKLQGQRGPAHFPVHAANNNHYDVYIKGSEGTYRPHVKPFSPLVSHPTQEAVRECYLKTGDPVGCAQRATHVINHIERGNVNRQGISNISGEFIANPRRPCQCSSQLGVAPRARCNCGGI